MKKPKPFQDSDERDELRAQIRSLTAAKVALETLREDPHLAQYRLVEAGSDVPLMPMPAELEVAAAVVRRAAFCLAHHHNERCRPGDDSPLSHRQVEGLRQVDLDDDYVF